jgi:hypothetical protein
MRVRRTLLAFVLLLSGCVTAGIERVNVVIFNYTSRVQGARIEIDGQPFFSGSIAMMEREPRIAAQIQSRLTAGRHHVAVTSGHLTNSLDFEVRGGTRTDLQILVNENGVTFTVAYGDHLYI